MRCGKGRAAVRPFCCKKNTSILQAKMKLYFLEEIWYNISILEGKTIFCLGGNERWQKNQKN